MSAVQLQDVLRHMNMASLSAGTELDALADMCDSAEGAIANRCGPLEATSVTSRVPGGDVLVLPVVPVLSLTSVTPAGGSDLTVADLIVNEASGVVEYTSGATFPASRYTVTYAAGRMTLPGDLRLAVLEMTRHLWMSQRGTTPGLGGAFPTSTDTEFPSVAGSSFALPWRVEQLIAPHVTVSI